MAISGVFPEVANHHGDMIIVLKVRIKLLKEKLQKRKNLRKKRVDVGLAYISRYEGMGQLINDVPFRDQVFFTNLYFAIIKRLFT